MKIICETCLSVAGPEFPVGRSANPIERAPMSDVGAFWRKQMRKQKNWVPFGATASGHVSMTRNLLFRGL